MPITVRPINELDLDAIVRIAEKTRGRYEPDLWERRVIYYLRRDPDGSLAAELDGEVVGFMLADVRSGEFGLEEPCAWIEVLGVDPDARGHGVGKALGEALLERYDRRGVRLVRTMVDPAMEGVAGFFESLGFVADRLRPYVKLLSPESPSGT